MTTYELDAKATAYFALKERIDALTAEAEAIKDVMKAEMVEQKKEELTGNGWSATWHNTKQVRFDAKKFKADHVKLYNAYSSETTIPRFTLSQIKA